MIIILKRSSKLAFHSINKWKLRVDFHQKTDRALCTICSCKMNLETFVMDMDAKQLAKDNAEQRIWRHRTNIIYSFLLILRIYNAEKRSTLMWPVNRTAVNCGVCYSVCCRRQQHFHRFDSQVRFTCICLQNEWTGIHTKMNHLSWAQWTPFRFFVIERNFSILKRMSCIIELIKLADGNE